MPVQARETKKEKKELKAKRKVTGTQVTPVQKTTKRSMRRRLSTWQRRSSSAWQRN